MGGDRCSRQRIRLHVIRQPDQQFVNVGNQRFDARQANENLVENLVLLLEPRMQRFLCDDRGAFMVRCFAGRWIAIRLRSKREHQQPAGEESD